MESGPGGCLGRTRRYGAGRGCFDHKSVAKNMVLFMKFDVNCPDSRFEDFFIEWDVCFLQCLIHLWLGEVINHYHPS